MSKVVYLFVLVVVLAACGRGTQSDKNLTMVDSLHHEAWRLQGMDDVKADSFQALQQQAVDLLHQGSPSCNPVEVLTQAGFMYCTTGDYLLGMTYIQEAADTLHCPDILNCWKQKARYSSMAIWVVCIVSSACMIRH